MISEYTSKLDKSYFRCSYSSTWLWFQNLFIGPTSRRMISWTHCHSWMYEAEPFLENAVIQFCFSWGYNIASLPFWAVGFGSYVDIHYHSKQTPGWHLLWILMHGHPLQCLNDDAPNLMSKSCILIKSECQSTAVLIGRTKLTPQALTADKNETNINSLWRAHTVMKLCKCSN